MVFAFENEQYPLLSVSSTALHLITFAYKFATVPKADRGYNGFDCSGFVRALDGEIL